MMREGRHWGLEDIKKKRNNKLQLIEFCKDFDEWCNPDAKTCESFVDRLKVA